MSLTGALQIGRTALSASQIGLQVTGNNLSNSATAGYSRQNVSLVPTGDQRWGGQFLGRGVSVNGITRQVDSALQTRLWTATSQEASAGVGQQFLSTVESLVNELGSNSLSGDFGRFYDAWSELATSPNRDGARALVVQQGGALASSIRSLRSDLFTTRGQLDQQIGDNVARADTLLSQIAQINVQISNAEGGSGSTGGQANSLRDQRDSLISQLSQLVDVSVVEQQSGSADILVGSTPVVLGGTSRGLTIDRRTVNGNVEITVNVRADGTRLSPTAGAIAGALEQRNGVVDATLAKLDSVTSQLIFQVNRIQTTGYGLTPITSTRSTQTVQTADLARAFNDPANTTFANLPFKAVNGGFLVTVKNTTTGATETRKINLDLDGINSAGQPGTQNDSNVTTLAADLSNVPNLSATINPDGTLSINAATGYSVSFSEDSSGVLAVLGVNSYFTGKDATDIGVRPELTSQPGLLATGRIVNGQPVDNAAALAVSGLRDKANDALGGASISGAWRDAAQGVGAASSSASSKADAASLVRQNLDAQRAAVSGVSVDEESINLLNYQRQYQGAAKFISAVDELTQTLLTLIR